MSIFNSVGIIVSAIRKKKSGIFKYTVEEQEKIINGFPEPIDNITRSYYQYKCQMKLYKPFERFIINIIALPILVFLFLKNGTELKQDVNDAIFFPDGKPNNILPDQLTEEYKKITEVQIKKRNMTRDDRVFFISVIKRYPFSWYFLAKCLIKLEYYSYEIRCHAPHAIIVCNEYSFTSSFLTAYCNQFGIKHINVMHGEKSFCLNDTFFRYDRCFIWDDAYKDLFISLRAYPNQFIVSVPRSLKFDNIQISKKNDYTYYLGEESGVELKKVISVMKELTKKGAIVSVRPHPRYTNINELSTYADTITIEDADEVSIEKSIMQTDYVVSKFSTVLTQAYYNGKKMVIDDVTDNERYNMLMGLRLPSFEFEHLLLSELI